MATTIKEICSFQSGGTPSKANPAYFGGNIPWITTVALNGRSIGAEDAVDWITEEAIQESAAKIVPMGSIMVGTRVGVGKVAINKVPMSTSQDIISLVGIDSERWDTEFLCRFIQSKSVFLNTQARGATIKGIKIESLAGLELPEVSLQQQHEIVLILNAVTDVITARQRQISTLDTLIKARFIEMFGDLADPASKWPTCRLIEACDESDDIKCGPFGTQLSKDEYQESGIPVWEIPQINSAFAIAPEHFLTVEKAAQLRAYSLSVGDIVMSRKGNVGKCAIFPADKPDGILHSDVLRIRVSSKITNPCFMMCQLHYSRDIIRQIEMVSSGAIMAGVNVTKLKEIIVKMPPLELQNQFAAFVYQVDKSKVAVQKALNEAQLLFDSLMQQYFG